MQAAGKQHNKRFALAFGWQGRFDQLSVKPKPVETYEVKKRRSQKRRTFAFAVVAVSDAPGAPLQPGLQCISQKPPLQGNCPVLKCSMQIAGSTFRK
eukprot:4478399-Amphidinium_carterae.1